MKSEQPAALPYRRARFVTDLPLGYLYSPDHFWLSRQDQDLWRIGLTKFGARLLGEVVDYGFEATVGLQVAPGEAIGWIEGFKTLSELLCLCSGKFAGANPALEQNITLVNQDPCGAGWLYAINGDPAGGCLDAHAYARVLDATIDKLLESR